MNGYGAIRERVRRLRMWNPKKTIQENADILGIPYNLTRAFAKDKGLKFKPATPSPRKWSKPYNGRRKSGKTMQS